MTAHPSVNVPRLTAPRCDVIVVRGEVVSKRALDDMAAQTGCLVIVLDDGQTLDTLDEAEMHAHGWVRCGQ